MKCPSSSRTPLASIAVTAALALVGVAGTLPAAAQGFGKNKITYEDFDWKIYRSPHFDIHYYDDANGQLEKVINEFESAYLDISTILDHDLTERIPVIVYNTHGDFQQTNIILQEIPDAVGGFSEPSQNRLVMPIDDPPDVRYKLARHELTHIFQFDIFYAASLRRALRGGPPFWLMEGMASYIGDDENSFDQMVIRDAVVNNLLPSVRQLDIPSFLTYRYGHAIFDFIEETYGPERMRTFVFEFRSVLLARDLEKAFRDAFGLTVNAFDRRFSRFLRRKYLPVLTNTFSPDEYGREIGFSRPGVFTFSPELSPSGELVATLSSVSGDELDVVVLSAKDGKKIRNVTKGFTNRYEQIISGAFEGKRDIAWAPMSDELAFFVRKENSQPLAIYDALSGRRLEMIPLDGIAAGMSPAYSPDGRYIAFSGNRDGVWDIFAYDLDTDEIVNVTQDEYVDSNPRWSSDGKRLIYNRRIGQFDKIFTVEFGAPARKLQLTGGASSDLQPFLSRDGETVYFVSDRGLFGVYNLHRLSLETGEIERLTDVAGGIFAPVELPPGDEGETRIAFAAYLDGTFRLFRMDLEGVAVERAIDVGEREPKTSPRAPSRREESIQAVRPEGVLSDLGPAVPPTRPTPAPVEPDEDDPPPPPAEPPEPPEPPSGSEETEPETEPEADAEDADLLPFEPPLDLGLDQERIEPYELVWDWDIPDFAVGVTDDGTFLANATLLITDRLGDHRILGRAITYDTFSNIQFAYYNLKRRLDWGVTVFDYRDYYFIASASGLAEERRSTRLTSVQANASYPFNRYFRLEGSAGYAQRREEYPIVDSFGFIEDFQTFSDDFPIASIALVGDTVRYRPSVGPYHGYQFRVGAFGYSFTGGDNSGETVVGYELAYRGYQRVTSRSLLAMRLQARIQEGRNATISAIGGINEIRGLRFRELFGDSYAFANFEFRFPLFNGIQWSFGMLTAPVQAFAFADVGSAWFNEIEYFDPEKGEFVVGRAAFDPDTFVLREFDVRDDEDLLQDVYASAGLGFTAPILGLPCTWTFSRRYDGEDFAKWSSSFYIVYNW